MKIKPDICTQCRFFEWKNKEHYCEFLHEFLNNLNPCEHGDVDDFDDFLNKIND